MPRLRGPNATSWYTVGAKTGYPVLEYQPDLLPHLAQRAAVVTERFTIEKHPALRGLKNPVAHQEQGGLPGTVGADQCNPGSFLYRECYPGSDSGQFG